MDQESQARLNREEARQEAVDYVLDDAIDSVMGDGATADKQAALIEKYHRGYITAAQLGDALDAILESEIESLLSERAS